MGFFVAQYGVGLENFFEALGRVADIPSSAFYSDPSRGSSFVRFAFCKQTKTIDEAIARLRGALR